MGYADAPAREAAWLAADLSALPAPIPPLTKTLGGPFHLIEPYGRLGRSTQTGRHLWVSRERSTEVRFAFGQKQHVHQMRLRIVWPVQAKASRPETDLADLDDAVEAVLERVRGPFGDATHGGRFLAVAEGDDTLGPPSIQVAYDDPEDAVKQSRTNVTVRYLAADAPFQA